jgi:methylaspartate mutase epsilon subunit
MASERTANPGFFHDYCERQRARGRLIVQPRMGFSSRAKMRRGLEAVRALPAPRIGTITLDSYTRQGDHAAARAAIAAGSELNGYPLVSHGAAANRQLVAGLQGRDFPIQVRHGTPLPAEVFAALIAAGVDATEGGPISYCFPYGRVPLCATLPAWADCCRQLAALREQGTEAHLESFGGCVMGQLGPPALLVAITVLEGLFFAGHGLASVSLSYAQGTSEAQDIGAVLALRRLATERLAGLSWHVVLYTFMGMFPRTRAGARRLIELSAEIAVRAGAERLVVKTAAEAHHVPSIEENVEALRWAHRAAATAAATAGSGAALSAAVLGEQVECHEEIVYGQASGLIDAVLDLDPRLERALELAFQRGFLDIPYCLHPDNRNRATSWLDHEGNLWWADPGNVPIPRSLLDNIHRRRRRPLRSSELADMLSYNMRKFDQPAAVEGAAAQRKAQA